MISGNWLKAIIASFVSGLVITFTLSMFVANYYLIYLVVDIVMAFTYAIVLLPGDRIHFYRYQLFHMVFSSDLVWFVGLTIVMCLIGIM